jgi:predicted phage terminase large subunit-like protein
MSQQSIEAFARAYLPSHFRVAPSSMHREVFCLMENMTLRDRGDRMALAAPRGHAKSTIVSLAFVLWCICYKLEDYIILISDTASQANDLLSHVKNELEANHRLLGDFPEVCEPPGSKPGPPRWRQDEIITRNEVRVTAFGAEKKIRGRRYRQHRPGLIILDDVENEEQVVSAERREKLVNWFTKAVLKAGEARTNVVVVGTIMHYDSLLAALVDPAKSPRWIGRKYQAVQSWSDCLELWQQWENIYTLNQEYEGESGPEAARGFFEVHREEMLEGTDVLWPEREDYYDLMALRLSEGTASFDSEKQNEPINPADCLFREEDFHYWDDKYSSLQELVDAIGKHGRFYGACDPSLGKAGRNRDDSAFITLLKDRKTGILYVADAMIVRRTPDKIIDTVLSLHDHVRYAAYGFESNQFQEYVADELIKRGREAGTHVPVRKLISKGDKMGRIQSLQPLVATGTIRFCRRHRTLVDQLRQFPKAAHDDGPDALEMAVKVAGKSGRIRMHYMSASGKMNWDRDDEAGEAQQPEEAPWWVGRSPLNKEELARVRRSP